MTLALRSSTQLVLAAAMAGAVALCCMFSFAPHARAATLTQDQLSNVQQLLASYGVDPQKINAVSAVLSDNGMHADSPKGLGACAAPGRSLMRGMRSDDVKTLQNRLVDDGFLTEDNATGFFGSSTEAAVKEWQARQGIVASGTPETTGWGMVGQRSLQALKNCQTKVEQHLNNVEERAASTTQRLQNIEHRIENRMSSSTPGQPPMPPQGPTAEPQTSAGPVGQFLSDYSDAFNQNLAAVATAPYNFYVPILSDFFTAIGLN